MKYKNIKVLQEINNTEDIVVDADLLTNIRYVPSRVRTSGNLSGKSFWLPEDFNWIIGKDSTGCLVLVPLKREGEDDGD